MVLFCPSKSSESLLRGVSRASSGQPVSHDSRSGEELGLLVGREEKRSVIQLTQQHDQLGLHRWVGHRGPGVHEAEREFSGPVQQGDERRSRIATDGLERIEPRRMKTKLQTLIQQRLQFRASVRREFAFGDLQFTNRVR